MRALLSAAGIALLLSACANGDSGGSIYFTDYGRYSASAAAYAARHGQMPLVVFGNPTAASQSVLDAAIARGLSGTHVDPAVVFSPVAAFSAPAYRTVAVFGGTTRESICSARPATATTGQAGSMAAAFCLDAEPLSFVAGSLPRLSGPADPKLQPHMASVGYALFPIANPDHADTCDFRSAICK
jgi:hypothetical protein